VRPRVLAVLTQDRTTVKKAASIASVFVLLLALGGNQAQAGVLPGVNNVKIINRRLCGTIVDYTHHHHSDNRIWSESLGEYRDMYVYLPPGYDPSKQYPIMLWLHGLLQDENSFVNMFAAPLDKAICCGELPPMIIAAPDGTCTGRPSIFQPNSFFLNSNVGNFEDYLIHDVWNFLVEHYSIRPEREAHILAGLSMGGFAAFNQAMKHGETFKVAIGIYPPLNLRWVDCHGRYFGNFRPDCWGWREDVSRGREVIGRFFFDIVKVRIRHLVDPLFDRDPDVIERLAYENPIEMLERLDVQPGQYDFFIAYGGLDQFNIDAQVESFLYVARSRGIDVGVAYAPLGHHSNRLALRLFPQMIEWLAGVMEPYKHLDESGATEAPAPVFPVYKEEKKEADKKDEKR
jgi:hypothetical protein